MRSSEFSKFSQTFHSALHLSFLLNELLPDSFFFFFILNINWKFEVELKLRMERDEKSTSKRVKPWEIYRESTLNHIDFPSHITIHMWSNTSLIHDRLFRINFIAHWFFIISSCLTMSEKGRTEKQNVCIAFHCRTTST